MKMKKIIALTIAAAVVMSNSVSAVTTVPDLQGSLSGVNGKEKTLITQISQEENLSALTDSDKVRVVVELNDSSVIEEATSKGKKVSEMKKTDVEKLQKKLLNKQDKVKKNIKAKGVKFTELNSFTNIANGFSIETTLGEAKTIESLDGVKSVSIANEYQRPEPQMNNSGEITNTVPTWELGYDGEGTVIAIIDTGIDSGHKDMVLTDGSKVELDKSEVNEIVEAEELPGKYYTEKVPYGYNYMDGNDEIRDLGPDASEHGMHVAGIAGANGDVENGGIKGTAPEAQLLAMKVFGNNPAMSSTFGDVVIKALDDSVLLGADIINMSLGSTAAFVDDEDPEQAAVNRAVDNGVVVSISAGNSAVFGNEYDNPYAENPDYGVVGAPGVATDSLQVASIENNIMTGYGVEFTVDGEEKVYPYTTSGTDILEVLKGKELKVVDCGLGGLDEHFPTDVAGNVALIQRGEYNFTDKIANAEKHGAVAVIVYNNASGGDGLINMMYPDGGKIPAVFVGLTAGTLMKDNAAAEGFTVSFNGASAEAVNPSAGSMSDFTSWGVTPDLEIKPEITGVGGNVWSTANDNGYQNMSGTSMAAPNVAGGSALILQRVEEDFPELTGEAKAKMVKKIMMSTAVPHVDNGNLQGYGVVAGLNYTSPRRQGAGVMDLYAAASTSAIVTDPETNECKVNLKEITGNTATFEVVVENFGDEAVTYIPAGTVQTDLTDGNYSYLQAQNLVNKNTGTFPISFSETEVTVAPKGSASLYVTIDLSNAVTAFGGLPVEVLFANGAYVEGFVTLTDPTDTNPQLSIPYMGFKGEWDKVPAIDASIYDSDRYTFYGFTSMATDMGGGSYDFLGIDFAGKTADASKIAFSPNKDGSIDTVTPVLSYLRNIKELEIEILDSKGNVIRTLAKETDLRKHYFDGKYARYDIKQEATWDGTANNKLVEDGDYTYRVKAKVDYEGAEWQVYDFPVKVDTVAPKVSKENVEYDEAAKTLKINATDNNENFVYSYSLINDGKVVAENATGEFTAEDLGNVNVKKCTLEVTDYAGNTSSLKLNGITNNKNNKPGQEKPVEPSEPTEPENPGTDNPGEYEEPVGPQDGDTTAPIVKISEPEFFGFFTTNNVVFKGTVEDVSAVKEVTFDGQPVELVFDKTTGMWNFEVTLTLENGYKDVYVNAVDEAGNELGFSHKIFVDSEAPVISINDLPKSTKDSSVFLSGFATDNFPGLKVIVNGNVISNDEADLEYFDTLSPAKYDFNNYEVKLNKGKNTIVVEVIDTLGNSTKKEFIVNKTSK